MSVAVLEQHPTKRLTSFGAQRTSWLMTLGDRYSEIGADALYRAHAASLSPLRCIRCKSAIDQLQCKAAYRTTQDAIWRSQLWPM
jgi:hypothetical protein